MGEYKEEEGNNSYKEDHDKRPKANGNQATILR
jgi:hypothetical protein